MDLSRRIGRALRMKPEVQLAPRQVKNNERNKPCPCQSGKKFKKCCMNKVIKGM